MFTWLGPCSAPAKSPAARLAELTEGDPSIDDTVPTDASKKKVNVSPGESVSGTVLTLNTDRTALDFWPAANSIGLTLKATREPVWARVPAGTSINTYKERLSTPISLVLMHR